MSQVEVGIEQSIIEMKNKVELMLDLAYSALFLQDRDIAREVLKLEEYFDWLYTQFQLVALSIFHEDGGKSDILGLIRLGTHMEALADTAAKIAETIIKLDISLGRKLFKLVAEEGEEFVSVAKIEEGSYLCCKSIDESQIESKLDIRILAVRRGNKWFFDPPNNFRINKGDIIIVRGYAEALDDIRAIASGKKSV